MSSESDPGPSQGRLIWFENTSLTHRYTSVALIDGTYQFTAPPAERLDPAGAAWSYSTYERLRTDPVINVEGYDLFFGGTNSYTSNRAFRQWNSWWSAAYNNYTEWNFGPAPLAWTTGVASNRRFIAFGTANLMVLNPD